MFSYSVVPTSIAMRDNFLPYIVVMLTGLVSSVFIGYVAWFNSKRPPGWEDAQRPGYIPKIGGGQEKDETTDNNNNSG